jgi:hypothetical protein
MYSYRVAKIDDILILQMNSSHICKVVVFRVFFVGFYSRKLLYSVLNMTSKWIFKGYILGVFLGFAKLCEFLFKIISKKDCTIFYHFCW